jgi:spore germination protein KC
VDDDQPAETNGGGQAAQEIYGSADGIGQWGQRGGFKLKGRRYRKYLFCTAVLLSCVSCLTGCFDRRELDTLGVVLGVAIDQGEKEGEIELTVQMANPSGAKPSGSKSKGKTAKADGGESGGSEAYINVSSSGKIMNYIVREIQHKMSRRIYVAHNQAIVLSEDLARSGVRDCLDFFARAPEARMTFPIFVSKGKAKEVLDVAPEFEKVPSVALSKMLKDQKITSHAPLVTEFDFVGTMISKTTAAVAPLVSLIDDDGIQRLNVSGSAVFKESIMVGELGETETRGLLFVKNKVKSGVLIVNTNDVTATIEIRDAGSKVTPVLYADGSSEFIVEEDIIVGLGDQTGSFNLSNPDNVPVMLDATKAVIRDEIQSAVDKSKELDADIFGFGEYLNRKYPDQWKDMKPKWDELYKNIKVSITVKIKADGSGRTSRPLTPEEE